MCIENQMTWLDRLACYIKNFKPNLEKVIWKAYENHKQVSKLPRPQDDSITLQELLQQLLGLGYSKEDLYNLVTNGYQPILIDIT